jgi:hypothetical protein
MKWLGNLVFAAWWGVMVYVGGAMALRHQVELKASPQLAKGAVQVGKKVLEKNKSNNQKPFVVLHLLDERCSCSKAVLEKIEGRNDQDSTVVVLTTSEPSEETRHRLEQKGIEVAFLEPQEAKMQFGLETVPWLVVLNRSLEVLYSGGYSSQKIRGQADVKYEEIMDGVRASRKVASFPTFGCVTSEKLRKFLLQF